MKGVEESVMLLVRCFVTEYGKALAIVISVFKFINLVIFHVKRVAKYCHLRHMRCPHYQRSWCPRWKRHQSPSRQQMGSPAQWPQSLGAQVIQSSE